MKGNAWSVANESTNQQQKREPANRSITFKIPDSENVILRHANATEFTHIPL